MREWALAVAGAQCASGPWQLRAPNARVDAWQRLLGLGVNPARRFFSVVEEHVLPLLGKYGEKYDKHKDVAK